jgi:hypothetical protein
MWERFFMGQYLISMFTAVLLLSEFAKKSEFLLMKAPESIKLSYNLNRKEQWTI